MGDKVTLVGFGTFERRARQARAGRNPKTGAPIEIAATVVPNFSAGKMFNYPLGALLVFGHGCSAVELRRNRDDI